VPWDEIDVFGELLGLNFLKLNALENIPSLSPFENLTFLRNLGIESYRLDALSRSVTLPGVSFITAWRPQTEWGLPELQVLAPNSRRFNLGFSERALDLSPLELTGIRSLIIQRCELADLRSLHKFDALEALYLNRLEGTVDLRPLKGRQIKLTLSRGGQYLGLDELGPGVKIRYF
jgi:hypothetical protein